ncbi:MAG: polysaccharide deacetylase family protein [Pseudomonadota bacterium]
MALKRTIIAIADRVGCFPVGLAVQRLLFGGHFIRVVNYHATPSAEALDRQLAYLTRHFAPAGPADLEACLSGQTAAGKPKLLLTFDDGYRSNYDVAAPVIERHGFHGYFFVPEGCIASDRAAADAELSARPGEPEARMTWDECRDLLARGHRIGCHTRTHIRLSDDLPRDRLADEIGQAGRDIAVKLGTPVEDFCWVGGEEWSYGANACSEIRKAGYRRVFMTNLYPVLPRSPADWIQRTNIEAHWPLNEVRFYLCGVMDIAYAPKRRRLARKLLGAPLPSQSFSR